jgi:hypothetical protein
MRTGGAQERPPASEAFRSFRARWDSSDAYGVPRVSVGDYPTFGARCGLLPRPTAAGGLARELHALALRLLLLGYLAVALGAGFAVALAAGCLP